MMNFLVFGVFCGYSVGCSSLDSWRKSSERHWTPDKEGPAMDSWTKSHEGIWTVGKEGPAMEILRGNFDK